MKIVALNKFEVYQGEEAWLPMILIGVNNEPILLPYNWIKMTAKVGTGVNVITKTTDDTSQMYCYTQGPGAFFLVKLLPADTLASTPNKDLDIEIILETYQPGMTKQVFVYSKSLKVVVPPQAA